MFLVYKARTTTHVLTFIVKKKYITIYEHKRHISDIRTLHLYPKDWTWKERVRIRLRWINRNFSGIFGKARKKHVPLVENAREVAIDH